MNKEEKEAIKSLKNIAENKEIDKLKEELEELKDRAYVKQTADSISFTMPLKVAEASMKVLEEGALAIENKRLNKLLEKQDKIIDKMAEFLEDELTIDEFCNKENCYADEYINGHCQKCLNCIKEYFKKEVEKDAKD